MVEINKNNYKTSNLNWLAKHAAEIKKNLKELESVKHFLKHSTSILSVNA